MSTETDKGGTMSSNKYIEERELVKKRGSYKGRLTTFVNYLNQLDLSTLTSTDANELQLRIGKMETIFDQFDEVQLQLECISDNTDIHELERNNFESQYYKSVSRATELLSCFAKSQEDASSSDKVTRASCIKNVRLPTIQLPKFSGSYNNWMEFRDTFLSLVHSNDDLDDINKFHYLRTSLEGSAAVIIQSVEFCTKNYNIAWQLLCERFDNKRLLVQNHVSALFNIECISKESSVLLKNTIDQINKNLRSLETLGEPVKQWDTLLIYIITHKLDSKTFREWEEYKGRLDKDIHIKFDTFITFLRNRADLIETIELSRTAPGHSNTTTTNKSNTKLKTMVSVQNVNSNQESSVKSCPKCKSDHILSNCPQFLALSNEARLQLLPNYKVCYNCFRTGHFANRCNKPGCKVCKRRHNTLIHVTDNKPVSNASHGRTAGDAQPHPPSSATASEQSASENVTLSASVTTSIQSDRCEVLLSTALVKVYDINNQEHIVRALLDSGSTSCLITEKLSHQLNLPMNCIDKSILGINNIASPVNKMCRVPMRSLNDNFNTNLQCFILPSITDNVPSRHIDLSDISLPSDICLADPKFHSPASIDLIIGADVFWDVLGSQHIKLGIGKPILHETRLGWIVSGQIINSNSSSTMQCNFVKLDNIQTQLSKFWQLEEVFPNSSEYSSEEKSCEDHFVKNTTRLKNGSFCVKIPLKQSADVLGDSTRRAKRTLLSVERRLTGSFGILYRDFMKEYESLGHMSERTNPESDRDGHFIPHHGVLRDSSTTTKLRVVFNGSCPTSSGVSYNDVQMVGPTVQDDLLSILLRFRMYKYVLSADVEKMYRTVFVHPDDRHLQQIYWRNDPSEPIKTFELNTVTYGTASAPFLATRCLKQIGLDCEDKKIGDIICHDFYVDDLLTGDNDLLETQKIRDQVSLQLASARMFLRKWKSNEPQLMSNLAQKSKDLNIGGNEPHKVLGLTWQTDQDELHFPLNPQIVECNNTKRDMLSSISQIFDPLGLLSPCIISMKMLLQKLWLSKVSWDEQLSSDIIKTWVEIVNKLPCLNNLRVPRIVVSASYDALELHIFTDASERAYGACVYVRSANSQGDVLVRLLLAKSRVAPIKPTTIPRLELCGALIGARLYEKVMKSVRTPIQSAVFWTDSTIVLGWLKMLPSRLQPFVRNRVAEILEKTGSCTWRHVPTKDNPADFISRGVNAESILSLDLWWSGPNYLQNDSSTWPCHPGTNENILPETRPEIALHVSSQENNNTPNNFIDFNRFSNFLRLKRSIAYVLRFISACRKQRSETGCLTEQELQNSLNVIIRTSQRESFPEFNLLKHNQPLPNKSSLIKLNAYLDDNHIMRVGGRLVNSNFTYEKKHPIILQSTHQLTKIIFHYEHKKLFHAGPQLLLASIRETYWPVGGRNLAKSCYQQCTRCFRMKGKTIAPMMGNLPQQRLIPGGHPFENVGVDYAGPILSASRQGRGCRLVKVYIAVFVCFTTKAIHLELVGDLTSNIFLCALRRFISRRGKPINIYSDNGTSFVGAYNDLSKFLKSNCNSLSESVANEGISFHFIPAYSPHFGGLWEAGVKSVKYHLQRVLGNCNLTYEELCTTLCQIEAILNSRPLTPLSSDPEDLTPLTPGHFLIGRPLTALPTREYQDSTSSHLTRFQRIEQLRQQFWKRWSIEYISELQSRTKWRLCTDSLKMNSLVLIKEDHLPPLKWKLGRVVATYPGTDGISRVADIKTTTGIIRRSFSRICPLPAPQ